MQFVLLGLLALTTVAEPAPPQAGGFDAKRFGGYWYQGKAELTRYSLDQARYGETHRGEAVMIFVTEPFLPDRQVKLERGDPSKGISVLKLNAVRKFFTGLYPYSLMTSTFTPVDFRTSPTLKVASSSQEWCGLTYTQLNRRGSRQEGLLRSYFEAEGDSAFGFPAAWLEDEIWTRIRLAPETLPTGAISIVPGLQYARLLHRPVRPEKARASVRSEGADSVYALAYDEIGRTLTIRFESAFPWRIRSWEETTRGGIAGSPPLTTKATATKSLMLDYWNRHGNADAHLRRELGLTMW